MLGLSLAVAALLAPEIPSLTGRVVDRAEILSPEQESDLERRLETIERESSVQIVIGTILSLEGEPLEDFSLRLAEAWRIGQKGLDNGIIVLVVHQERQVRIEVGYGLESVIPDGLAGRIIRERMAPRFRTGDFHGGLSLAIDGLALAARREYPAATPEPTPSPWALWFLNNLPNALAAYFAALFGWFVVFGILWDPMGLKTWWSSAVPAAIFFTLATYGCGWLTVSNFFWVVPLFFVLGALVSPFGKYMDRASYGAGGRGGRSWTSGTSSSGRSSGGSSWSSSGSSSSSTSSGSGFSGGGGRFGGGGASGTW